MTDSCPKCAEPRHKASIGVCKHPWHVAVALSNSVRKDLPTEEEWGRIEAMVKKMRDERRTTDSAPVKP